MINFFIHNSNEYINYNNVDESKSKIRLQKIKEDYFMIYEFKKYPYTKDKKKYYVVLAKFSTKPYINWEKAYASLEKNILTLIKTYTLPYKLVKHHDILNSIIIDEKIENKAIDNILFTQEGFDLITNKFLYTDGIIEKTIIFENNYNELIQTNSKYYQKLEYYYYNHFLNDNEIRNMNLKQMLGYVQFNKKRLENIINTKVKCLQKEYYSIKDSSKSNEYLTSFVDSQIELSKSQKTLKK